MHHSKETVQKWIAIRNMRRALLTKTLSMIFCKTDVQRWPWHDKMKSETNIAYTRDFVKQMFKGDVDMWPN